MPDDFVENIKRADAAKAARERAIAPAQRPRRSTNKAKAGGYGPGALSRAYRRIVDSSTRNNDANEELFNMGQLIAAGELDRATVEREIGDACRTAGLPEREIRTLLRDDESGGINRGIASGPRTIPESTGASTKSETSQNRPRSTEGQSDAWDDRRILVKPLNSVRTRVPMWVWDYEGLGRIQLGTLSLFAGKPATGKSTATRWFAARLSDGSLPGVWYGYPMRVAIYSPEEQLDDTIAPSMQAHGADMSNVVALSASDAGIEDGILSVRDEQILTETLTFNNIRALFVDPVIQTFDTKVVDPNKTSDVRRHLMPYVRIAKAINGIVVGVTHLRKGNVIDVMTNINGSSAFGEVPRSVFGFASVGDGMNVLEQVKNSAGLNGLKLEYRLPIERGLADDGQYYELPRFEIKGETELSIADIGGNDTEEDATTSGADVQWLERYLQIEQPAPSYDIYRIADKQAGMTRYRVTKARRKLKVRIVNTPKPDAPHTTAWCLPDYEQP